MDYKPALSISDASPNELRQICWTAADFLLANVHKTREPALERGWMKFWLQDLDMCLTAALAAYRFDAERASEVLNNQKGISDAFMSYMPDADAHQFMSALLDAVMFAISKKERKLLERARRGPPLRA
jgi:hypothetical protein